MTVFRTAKPPSGFDLCLGLEVRIAQRSRGGMRDMIAFPDQLSLV